MSTTIEQLRAANLKIAELQFEIEILNRELRNDSSRTRTGREWETYSKLRDKSKERGDFIKKLAIGNAIALFVLMALAFMSMITDIGFSTSFIMGGF